MIVLAVTGSRKPFAAEALMTIIGRRWAMALVLSTRHGSNLSCDGRDIRGQHGSYQSSKGQDTAGCSVAPQSLGRQRAWFLGTRLNCGTRSLQLYKTKYASRSTAKNKERTEEMRKHENVMMFAVPLHGRLGLLLQDH